MSTPSYNKICRELYELHWEMWRHEVSPDELKRLVRRKAMRSLYADLIETYGGLEEAIKVFKPSGMEEIGEK